MAQKPFLVGVAGGSGSGKTTVVENLIRMIGSQRVVQISHDNYYRDQSHKTMEERVLTNYDHPNSLETELLVHHLQDLCSGKSVQMPTYDFVHHTRAEAMVALQPSPVILVEGILIFEHEALRDLFDLKIFVDTDPDVRLARRILRDVAERGRTHESSIAQYLEFTRLMHLQFVEPNKRYADIIIPEGGENIRALELLQARIDQLLDQVSDF